MLDPRTQGLRFLVPEPRHPRVPGTLVAVPSGEELPASRALTAVWSDLWSPKLGGSNAGGYWAVVPVAAAVADQGPRHGRSGLAGLIHKSRHRQPPLWRCQTWLSGKGAAPTLGHAVTGGARIGLECLFRWVEGGAADV